jgi:hypothetical protein
MNARRHKVHVPNACSVGTSFRLIWMRFSEENLYQTLRQISLFNTITIIELWFAQKMAGRFNTTSTTSGSELTDLARGTKLHPRHDIRSFVLLVQFKITISATALRGTEHDPFTKALTKVPVKIHSSFR